jgi:hypothetical protein
MSSGRRKTERMRERKKCKESRIQWQRQEREDESGWKDRNCDWQYKTSMTLLNRYIKLYLVVYFS